MAFVDLQTKPCIFCAETIQARAVKCRFCGEFLNSEKAKALIAEAEAKANPDAEAPEEEEPETDDGILFAGRPSLWGMASSMVKSLFVLALAWCLIKFPLEEMANKPLELNLTADEVSAIGQYRVLAAYVIGVLVLLILLIKILKLK
ncbi:MAG: hypothetical protein U9Q07_07225, partial [Planctomycetota bacterium]|nr:hypothetical protein [Planctomycetota bacterium]